MMRYPTCVTVLCWLTCFKIGLLENVAAGDCNETNALLSAEHRLIQCLTTKIDTAVRPALTTKEVVHVSFDMSFLHIVSLNEMESTIDVNGWATQTWTDPRLKWDPEEYENVKKIRIPSDRIWTPDILLLNTAEMKHSFVMDKYAIVTPQGLVVWVPHLRMRAFCGLDLSRFPFDTQRCHLLFGSWAYDDKQVDVKLLKSSSMNHIWQGKEWDIIKYQSFNRTFTYVSADTSSENMVKSSEAYPYVVYEITMKRNGVFYGTLLVAPPVLLAMLTTIIFAIPPDAGQRINLGVGIVITLTLMITVIERYIPPEIEGMPVIFTFLLFDFVMVTFALLMSILVLNLYHRDARRGKIPNWIRMFFLGKLRAICCLKSETYNAVPSGVSFVESSGELRFDGHMQEMTDSDTASLPKSSAQATEKVLEDIRKYLHILAHNASTQSPMMSQFEPAMTHKQMIVNEWQQLAAIIDRVMFFLYIVTTAITTLIILH